MSYKIVEDSKITAIADAIRTKGRTTATINFGELALAITDLPNKLPSVVDKTVTEITAEDLQGATKLGNNIFESCTALTSCIIPDSVLSIGTYVFYKCTSLASVTIGNGVTSIGGAAFNGCTSLVDITCNATTPPTITSSSLPGTSVVQHIYVPYASVAAYKAATNWAAYADVIVPILEITTLPQDVIAAVGTTISMNVVAVGDSLKYQWQYFTPESTVWKSTTVTGAKTDTITMEATTARNGNRYRCVITDAYSKKVISYGALVTVTK